MVPKSKRWAPKKKAVKIVKIVPITPLISEYEINAIVGRREGWLDLGLIMSRIETIIHENNSISSNAMYLYKLGTLLVSTSIKNEVKLKTTSISVIIKGLHPIRAQITKYK